MLEGGNARDVDIAVAFEWALEPRRELAELHSSILHGLIPEFGCVAALPNPRMVLGGRIQLATCSK